MDAAERLADYLAGELDADERAALEATLARDAGLRARLEAMQRADTALGGLESVTPSAGYEERLRTAVDTALHAELGTAPESAAVAGDELAERRQRRSRRWVPALAGAAAAIVVVAGVTVLVRGGLPGQTADDLDVAMDMAEDDAEAPAAEPETLATDGPIVVVSDRDLDEDGADALLAAGELAEVADRQLDAAAGASLATSWRAALDPAALDGGAAVLGDDADAPETESPAPPADAEVSGGRALASGDRTDIERCLDELLVEGDPPIPVYIELVHFEGEPAVVYGLVTPDPATAHYGRAEVWVLSRSDCQVLRFSQR